MDKPITPEMIAAWRTLQTYASSLHRYVNPTAEEKVIADAIDVLDNSDFMVPIEDAGLCTYDVGGVYHSPPEHCGAEIDGVSEYCPKHEELAAIEPPEEEEAVKQVGKCPHCGHPRVPLTPEGLTMYHGDVKTRQGDCLGSLQKPEEPSVGLPTLEPGEEIRPAFSDTHPRAARELGEIIGGEQS